MLGHTQGKQGELVILLGVLVGKEYFFSVFT